MAFIGALLIIAGAAAAGLSSVAFGDIGLAMLMAGVSALLSGIGLLIANKRLKKLEK